MSLYNIPVPGINNTNSYLSSGIPYLTGSTLLSSSFATNNSQKVVSFPRVTRTVTIVNRTTSVPLRIHFNSLDDPGQVQGGLHYLTLDTAKDSFTFNVKCTEIYISLATGSADGAFECVAELTNIPRESMYILSGSGLTD